MTWFDKGGRGKNFKTKLSLFHKTKRGGNTEKKHANQIQKKNNKSGITKKIMYYKNNGNKKGEKGERKIQAKFKKKIYKSKKKVKGGGARGNKSDKSWRGRLKMFRRDFSVPCDFAFGVSSFIIGAVQEKKTKVKNL